MHLWNLPDDNDEQQWYDEFLRQGRACITPAYDSGHSGFQAYYNVTSDNLGEILEGMTQLQQTKQQEY